MGERVCKEELGLRLDEQCINGYFPCYKETKGKCFDVEGKKSQPQCPAGTSLDRIKCASYWPDYACYEPRMRHCVNEQGVVLVDPIGDLAYTAALFYSGAVDSLFGSPTNKEKQEARLIKSIDQFQSLIGQKFFGTSRVMNNLLTAKKAENRSRMAENYTKKAANKWKGKGGNTLRRATRRRRATRHRRATRRRR